MVPRPPRNLLAVRAQAGPATRDIEIDDSIAAGLDEQNRMAHAHAGMDGGGDPFAIQGKGRVIEVMQICAVGMLLGFPSSQIIKTHALRVVINHVKPGILLRQITYRLAVRGPKRESGAGRALNPAGRNVVQGADPERRFPRIVGRGKYQIAAIGRDCRVKRVTAVGYPRDGDVLET